MCQQQQQLQGPEDCQQLLNYLLIKLQNIQSQLQDELNQHSHSLCIGQIACNYMERQVFLMDEWIREWYHDESHHHHESQQNIITFYEFLIVCEIYLDNYPIIAQKIQEIERLFLPRCYLIDPTILDSSRPNTSRSVESQSAKTTTSKNKK